MTHLVRALLLVVAVGVLGLPARALAHAEYERSSPGAGAIVRSAPARLDLWFTQELFRRAGANTLAVTAADGRRVDAGGASVDTADRKHLSVALMPDLPPGAYTVAWTSLSATDGDSAAGSFTFSVDPNAAAPAGGQATGPSRGSGQAAATGAGGTFPVWAAGAVALFAMAIGLSWWAVRGGPRS